MLQEKFALGPWKAERRSVVSAEHCIVDAKGEWVADVSDTAGPEARLIAEAPSMFILLREYLRLHSAEYIRTHPGIDGHSCPCHECIAVRRIVARVLGEE